MMLAILVEKTNISIDGIRISISILLKKVMCYTTIEKIVMFNCCCVNRCKFVCVEKVFCLQQKEERNKQ